MSQVSGFQDTHFGFGLSSIQTTWEVDKSFTSSFDSLMYRCLNVKLLQRKLLTGNLKRFLPHTKLVASVDITRLISVRLLDTDCRVLVFTGFIFSVDWE